MAFRTLKSKSRLGLIALALACVGLLLWARPSHRISTDVLELIPSDERQPELVLIRSLAGEQRARVALFALHVPGDEDRRTAAGLAFAGELRKSPAFESVVMMNDTTVRDALARHLFAERFNLLFPAWVASRRAEYAAQAADQPWPDWLAARTARELESFLGRPEALAFQELVPSDPLLLLPSLVDSVKGLDVAAASSGGPLLVWSTLSEPPLSEKGQQPVFDAVERATGIARRIAPDMRVRWTSLARFAAASRQRIERELSTLNLASLLAVLVVAGACLRQVHKVLNLAPVVLGATLVAWAVVLAVFPHVHVLVFVVGSLLTGVAIDYGVYLYLQPPAHEGEPYAEKARRLLRPLLGSALTAILGFSLLVFSPLPLIRQLGVFVSAGLLGAVAVALLWFAQVRTPYIETRHFVRARLGCSPVTRRFSRLLLLGAAVVAVAGPWRLSWLDNIRQLEITAPALEAEAREVRALFGERDDRTTYLTRGATVREARDSLERFTAWHDATYPSQPLSSAGRILPTGSEWDALPHVKAELADFQKSLAKALAAAGFEADSFAPFARDWNAWLAAPQPDYDANAARLAAAMSGPLSALFSVSREGVWFVSLAPHRPDRDPPPDYATASASQLENLNRLFSRYRTSALHLSLIGLGLVGLSVFLIYGLRHGAGIFAVPLGACFFTFGLLGLAGQTLNLFHLLGAFLGVCLSHNYSIFSAENELRGQEQPPSIRLSALSTAASFGVLAFSRIPVVSALGLTVSLIVLSALAIVELKLLAQLTPRGPS